jgi:hypothetical protein
MFWEVLVIALVFSLIGYMRGREDGRAAERRDVKFTPVDKLEPREGYDPQAHYCPGLATRAHRIDRILYPHGVRCIDCNEPLKDKDIFRRPCHVEGVDDPVVELVCFGCLTNQNSKGV